MRPSTILAFLALVLSVPASAQVPISSLSGKEIVQQEFELSGQGGPGQPGDLVHLTFKDGSRAVLKDAEVRKYVEYRLVTALESMPAWLAGVARRPSFLLGLVCPADLEAVFGSCPEAARFIAGMRPRVGEIDAQRRLTVEGRTGEKVSTRLLKEIVPSSYTPAPAARSRESGSGR